MGEKLKIFPLNKEEDKDAHSHPFSQARKEIEGIQVEKKEVILSLFADDIILYIDNPKDPTKKLSQLINCFSKVAGYKINI